MAWRVWSYLLAGGVLATAGCGNSAGSGPTTSTGPEVQMQAAAHRTNGDWSKLTPEEQKMFLDKAHGNQASAQQMLGFMAAGPKS